MHPYAVLAIRRHGKENRAGLAVCSVGDHFIRRAGRNVALERFYRRPLVAQSPLDLSGRVVGVLLGINSRRKTLYTSEEALLASPTIQAFCSKMRDSRDRDPFSAVRAAHERMYGAAQEFIRRVSSNFTPTT